MEFQVKKIFSDWFIAGFLVSGTCTSGGRQLSPVLVMRRAIFKLGNLAPEAHLVDHVPEITPE
jgi:hypothetical protein